MGMIEMEKIADGSAKCFWVAQGLVAEGNCALRGATPVNSYGEEFLPDNKIVTLVGWSESACESFGGGVLLIPARILNGIRDKSDEKMEEKQKSKRGGYRENNPMYAPLYDSGAMRVVAVRLTEAHIEKARRASEKNEAGDGIRKILDNLT